MTDDIVTRLRMATTFLPPSNVCHKAANEIEQLREQNEWLRLSVQALKKDKEKLLYKLIEAGL